MVLLFQQIINIIETLINSIIKYVLEIWSEISAEERPGTLWFNIVVFSHKTMLASIAKRRIEGVSDQGVYIGYTVVLSPGIRLGGKRYTYQIKSR